VTDDEPTTDQATRSLTRNALALVLNTVVTSVLGMGFWVLAAHLYDRVELGRDSALVSAMFLLAAVSELNLGLALPRFLPQLGERSASTVLRSYVASAVAAVVVTGAVVLVVPHVSRSLAFLGQDAGVAASLVVAVMLWNVFALQDAVLAALRRTSWIPVENTIFGVAKIVLMVALSRAAVGHGVFLAWVVPMAVMLVPVNVALFRWAIPHHVRTSPPASSIFAGEGSRRKVVRYLALDYAASLLVQGSLTFMPIVVVAILGPEQNAYFYVAFSIVGALDQMAHNIGLSLTVEGAFDEALLGRLTRHTIVRFGIVLVPGLLGLVVLAVPMLWLFGPDFAKHSVTVLRLLVLASIPQALLHLYQAVERVRGRAGRIMAVTLARFVVILVAVVLLGRHYGLAGVGWGWFLGQVVVLLAVLPALVRVVRQGRVAA